MKTLILLKMLATSDWVSARIRALLTNSNLNKTF